MHEKWFCMHVVHAKLHVHKTAIVCANLHHSVYSLLIAIVFSLHTLLPVNSKKYQFENMLNTEFSCFN